MPCTQMWKCTVDAVHAVFSDVIDFFVDDVFTFAVVYVH